MITIQDAKKSKILPETFDKKQYDCPENGNCTTLRDLAEAMRRVMMHEVLPANERFRLGKRELSILRWCLNQSVKKGGVWEGIHRAYGSRPVKLYHKPGYADGWFSDNVFVHVEGTDERWLVAMANRRGRESCDEPGMHVGLMLASGDLSRERRRVFGDRDD